MPEPLTVTPSRLTVLNPEQREGDDVSAGAEIDELVAAVGVGDRGPDFLDQHRAGGFDGDAGQTAPEVSLTVPVIDACARAIEGMSRNNAPTRAPSLPECPHT